MLLETDVRNKESRIVNTRNLFAPAPCVAQVHDAAGASRNLRLKGVNNEWRRSDDAVAMLPRYQFFATHYLSLKRNLRRQRDAHALFGIRITNVATTRMSPVSW